MFAQLRPRPLVSSELLFFIHVLIKGNIVSITPDDNPTTSELLPWLKSLLISMSSAVDRSGAAQGLAEVMYSKGAHTLDQVMPHMLEEAGNISLPPTVRDGYCMAFIYFPVVFKQHFSGYVSKVYFNC